MQAKVYGRYGQTAFGSQAPIGPKSIGSLEKPSPPVALLAMVLVLCLHCFMPFRSIPPCAGH
jgi:hypothetical protein